MSAVPAYFTVHLTAAVGADDEGMDRMWDRIHAVLDSIPGLFSEGGGSHLMEPSDLIPDSPLDRYIKAGRRQGGVMRGWIGVDLDGTLAGYDGWRGPDHIGPPVPAMLERVKAWLAAGHDVRVFTARVSHDGSDARYSEAVRAARAIEAWCEQHIGRALPITNVKDYGMVELWDDRAVTVEANTGLPLAPSTRGLA